MADLLVLSRRVFWAAFSRARDVPLPILTAILFTTVVATLVFVYAAVLFLAPTPRAALPSEKSYITTAPDGSATKPRPLPCWHDEWLTHRKKAEQDGDSTDKETGTIDGAEVEMSVVIPAYNEEERLSIMLEEAIEFLDATYGRKPGGSQKEKVDRIGSTANGGVKTSMGGYEVLLVNDGSRDKTVDVALDFSRRKGLHDILRICTLKENRGKGGAVTHGLRHVRGAYAIFADADGASRFSDVVNLVKGCKQVADDEGRGIAVGSRAHLVGSEAVVKRSALRNALMHSFHLLLRLLTPPATSRIRDTQCGFKLFSRATLPHIVPYMHAEGWIFDVEMLMLAESAPPCSNAPRSDGGSGIGVTEVPIGWKEVGGSKLNVMWDSLGMAWGLAILRASWLLGVYKRR